jgi:bifunctional non-homologous end joining protein LigD
VEYERADKRANFWYMIAMAKAARTNPTTATPAARRVELPSPLTWVKPQLAKLVSEAPDGPDWLHELKLDGYRMHARFDAGRVQILTRRGLDWTEKYPAIAQAIAELPARNAYLDGELCGVLPDGRTAFNLIQNATDTGGGPLVFFLFDLLHLDGENLTALPLLDRKTRLASLLKGAPDCLRYNESPNWSWPGLSSAGVQKRRRGHRLETHQWPVRARPAHMAQDQMPQPRRVCRRRVE